MNISINKNNVFYYFILYTACFNDILRIGDSKITLFRVVMIAGIALCFHYFDVFKKFIIFIGLCCISLIQSLLFSYTNNIGIVFLPKRFIEYLYFYFCIFSVLMIIDVLAKKEGRRFNANMFHFISVVAKLYLLIFILCYFIPNIRNILCINNINDYGAMLAAAFPFLLVKQERKKYNLNLAYQLLIFVFAFLNDCKLVIVAILLEYFIFILLKVNKNQRLIIAISLLLLLVLVLSVFLTNDIIINGYNMNASISGFFNHVINLKMYPQSNTSQTYRTNVMITCINWLLETKFIGIGAGNTGILIKKVLSKHGLYEHWLSSQAVSPHNAILEIALDFGFIGIYVYVLYIIKCLKLISKNINNNTQYMIYVIMVISSVVWLMEPSIIWTDYFIFILLYFSFKSVNIK